jgi:hypothetical protein
MMAMAPADFVAAVRAIVPDPAMQPRATSVLPGPYLLAGLERLPRDARPAAICRDTARSPRAVKATIL